jgi:pyruvate/2-oxoglutarate dehydrogenase complex dihydrolipoamide acyltransferase (E2) component
MRVASGRSNVHGLVEADVTDARGRIRAHEAATGTKLSFTAFVAQCLAAAVDDHPYVNAYRDWRGRVHTFDDVDVNVLVETETEAGRVGVPHVVRAANHRSLQSIHDEIRRVQTAPADASLSQAARFGLSLPAPIRRLAWRLPQWFPRRWKALAGTVSVTSVGMFGTTGGWAVTPTNYTLQVAVGGIASRPRYVDGELTERELLSLTVTFDHDVVDGADAARFVDRFVELVEGAHGLPRADD